MRYSLRNQTKIAESLGSDYLDILINSLNAYFKATVDIPEYTYEKLDFKIIHVPSTNKNSEITFEFAIIDKTYDVYRLAYYSAFG